MNAVDILDGKNLTIRGFNISAESRRSTMKDSAPSADIFVHVDFWRNVEPTKQAEILNEIEDAITNVLEERR